MNTSQKALVIFALNQATLLLFIGVLLTFSLLSPAFLNLTNVANLFVQSSSTMVVGVGMTFVLLTAGVDLSVGAIMFVAAAVAGKLTLISTPLPVTLVGILAVGMGLGLVNAILITRLRGERAGQC